MSAPPWTPEKNITMKKVLRPILLEVNSCLLETYKALFAESDLFPVVSHFAEPLEKRWLSLTAD